MMKKLGLSLFVTAMLVSACSTTEPVPTEAAARQPVRQSGSIPEAVPVSFAIVPSSVVGGDAGTPNGTVTVDVPASFDRILNVSSNNPNVLPFLSSATTVPAHSTRANVLLITSAVSVPTVVTVFVSGGGVTVSADLTVNPPGTPPPPPTLSSFAVSPSTVFAGAVATGTISAPTAAPAGGLEVSVFSRIPGSATVPPTVTIPAGATSVSFPVTTHAGFPNSATSVLLTATNANTLVSSSITVVTRDTTMLTAPELLKPLNDQRFASGTNITFDWSDVTGASGYTIQIDDKSTFPAPLIVNANVTVSQFSISTLPRATMWWRARANSATGSGPWSAVRRFEVK